MNENLQSRWALSRMVALSALVMAVGGCGGSDAGPQRVAVEGEVSFRGEPLEKGSILFIPMGETSGPRTGAVVNAGRYRLSEDRGPVVGQLRVEIRDERNVGYDMTEPTETVQHIGEPLPPLEIPEEYNDRSVLVVYTTAEGHNSFDFHLPVER